MELHTLAFLLLSLFGLAVVGAFLLARHLAVVGVREMATVLDRARQAAALALLLFVSLGVSSGCAYFKSGQALDDVLAVVSPSHASVCAEQPNAKERARCVGVSTMSKALEVALARAAELANKALEARAPQGSESPGLTVAEERKLARDLDRAMDELASEIAAQKRRDLGFE